ncbi:MAG: hypothetical protein U5L95_01585 [Candidatus Saccharibacteria bacterium]|nr:hypothetical protein [Candidatus Saccharibacteria bacterium]
MARLPVPGGDVGNWGEILNSYLKVSHDSGGAIKSGSVTNGMLAGSIAQNKITNLTSDLADKYVLPGGGVPEADLSSAVQTKLNASTAWGGITGTLSDQTDLQTALDAKFNTSSIIDDDTFATATASNVASAESTKTYIDTEVAAVQSDVDDLEAAQTEINALPAGTTPDGTEEFPADQSGTTVKFTLDEVGDLLFGRDITMTPGVDGHISVVDSSGVPELALRQNTADSNDGIVLSFAFGQPAISLGAGSAAVDVLLVRTDAGKLRMSASGGAVPALEAPVTNPIVSTTVDRTFVGGDVGKIVEVTHGSTVRTQTVPPNSSVAYPVGSNLYVRKTGTANVAIAAGSGVTIRDPNALGLTISTQYETRRLMKRATDEWVMTRL